MNEAKKNTKINTKKNTKKNQSWWYFFERYVHVNVRANDVLVYNTLNGKYLVYRNCPGLAAFVRRLTQSSGRHVVELSRQYLDRNPDIARFVRRTRKYFMADFIDKEFTNVPPFQLPGEVYIHRDVERLLADEQRSVGEDLKINFDRLTIYLNSSVNPLWVKSNPGLFENAFRQFTTNIHIENTIPKNRNLDWKKLQQLFREIAGSHLTGIEIVGGDIFAYPHFKEMCMALSSIPTIKHFFVPFFDIEPHRERFEGIKNKNDIRLVVLVPFTPGAAEFDGELKRNLEVLQASGIPFMLQLIVKDQIQFEAAVRFMERTGGMDISIQPFFNGKNRGFFKKNIFLKPGDIIEAGPGLDEINIRKKINPLNFGKLTVMPNGKVYGSINHPAVGRLGNDSLYTMIYTEMKNGKSWRQVRAKVKPCNGCIFQNICPPLSGYEGALRRNNLCTVLDN